VNERELRLARVCAQQDGLATVVQLLRIGFTRKMIRTRVERGEWIRLAETVIALRSAPSTWRQSVRAAWFAAGADSAISHVTAGRLHGFDGLARVGELHVSVCGERHRTSLPGVHVHRASALTPRDVVTVDGIKVVSKRAAVIQIAGSCHRDLAEKVLDSALRDGVKGQWIGDLAGEWQSARIRGAALTQTLLRDRFGRPLPRSWFQRVAKRIFATRNLRFVDELPVKDPSTGRTLAVLDLALPDLKIGVECQSWEWHSTPTAQAADARRKRRLRLLGWEIVEVWWSDLGRIDEIVAEIEYVIDQRMPRLEP
jgi:hypothetical protein